VWETIFDEWRKVLRIILDGPSSVARRSCQHGQAELRAASSNCLVAGKEGNPNAAHLLGVKGPA